MAVTVIPITSCLLKNTPHEEDNQLYPNLLLLYRKTVEEGSLRGLDSGAATHARYLQEGYQFDLSYLIDVYSKKIR